MPKVSVIVPNYNHAKYLGRRLQSIAEQTYKDFELIMLDDASTDDSLRVIEDFTRTFPARLISNNKRRLDVMGKATSRKRHSLRG